MHFISLFVMAGWYDLICYVVIWYGSCAGYWSTWCSSTRDTFMKKIVCQECQNLLTDNNQELTATLDDSFASEDELEAGRSFLAAINRGGLIKPSNIVYITCLHAAELYQYIKDDNELKTSLLSSKNARGLFTEVFVSKLEEAAYTNEIWCKSATTTNLLILSKVMQAWKLHLGNNRQLKFCEKAMYEMLMDRE